MLHVADDKLEAISVSEQLANARVGRRVRKRRNAGPVNDSWVRNHAFVREPTSMCLYKYSCIHTYIHKHIRTYILHT